eukprot:5276025-Pyramimonas_sp.AAC.1
MLRSRALCALDGHRAPDFALCGPGGHRWGRRRRDVAFAGTVHEMRARVSCGEGPPCPGHAARPSTV